MVKTRYYSLFIVLLAYLFMTFGASAAETMGRMPGAILKNYKDVKRVTCLANESCGSSGVREVGCTYGPSDLECQRVYLGNCDPLADSIMDAGQSESFRKSCAGLGITRSNFIVPIIFWPAQPCTGTPCIPTGPTITYTPTVGATVMPKSYTKKDSDGSIVFNIDLCPGSVPSGYVCTPLTSVYREGSAVPLSIPPVSGSYVIDTPGSEIKYRYYTDNTSGNVVSSPCTNCTMHEEVIYPTLSADLTLPTSGNVQGDTGATITKYLDNVTNEERASGCSVDNTSPYNAGSCRELILAVTNSYTFQRNYKTTDGDGGKEPIGGVVGQPVPADGIIKNTKAVGNKAVGQVPCTVGQTAQYSSGQPVMSKDCELVKDLGLCKHNGIDVSTEGGQNSCNEYLVGGSVMYDGNGNAAKAPNTPITAVVALGTPVSTKSSPFTETFFASVSDDAARQQQINAKNEIEYGVSLSSSQAAISGAQETLIRFDLRFEGSKACVYGYSTNDIIKKFRVEGEYPKNLFEVFAVPEKTLPMCTSTTDPRNLTTPKTCQDYKPTDLDDTRVVNQTISSKHCVEAPAPDVDNTPLIFGAMISSVCTTYNNSSSQFYAKDSSGNDIEGKRRAFTGVVVECIEDSMLKIFFPTSSGGVVDQNDLEGTTFFSVMQDRMSWLVRLVLTLYVIVFGYKMMIGRDAPKPEEWKWLFMKFVLVTYFAIGSGMLFFLPKLINGSKYASIIVMEAGLSTENNSSYSSNSEGSATTYTYCDFRNKTYPAGKGYMKLWDMVDCRFSKYLGIGDNSFLPDAPQVLLVAILAPVSTGYGIPIFFFSLMTMAVIIMIIVRVVHIYIMSIIGLILLAYITPVVVPAVLFAKTKPIFDNWLEQITSVVLQPIILFGMLSFMLVAIDSTVFGDNHYFKNDKLVNANGIITSTNKTCSSYDTKCKDPYALGYLYQVAKVSLDPFPSDDFYIFKIWKLDFGGAGNDKYMFFGLLKLLLVVFIIYSVFSMTEDLAGQLVGGGMSSLSAAPVAGPAAVMTGIAAGVSGAKDAVANAAHAAKHYKSTARNSAIGKAARAGGEIAGAIKGKFGGGKGGDK